MLNLQLAFPVNYRRIQLYYNTVSILALCALSTGRINCHARGFAILTMYLIVN